MNLNTLLTEAAERFEAEGLYFGHGTDNAWDEAVWLVFHVLGLPMDSDRSVLEMLLTEEQLAKSTAVIELRIQSRKPAAYLTQEAWFCGLPFYVDERVLVPRSPFAEIVKSQFQPWVEVDDVKNILELCTGSGCIAIACAQYFPDAHIDATDISTDALAVAKINVEKHDVNNQVSLIQSDVFADVPNKHYDVIVSNPPYVDAEDMAALPDEYRQEPADLALAAGDDGLDIVKIIMKQAKKYLTETGILIVEVGNSYVALEAQFPDVPFVWLELENGGHGVFLLTKQDLTAYF
tara:strand:+ start:101583 stop:102458 length:876 start_codon:yes stop_codon:yes gene_type:complete